MKNSFKEFLGFAGRAALIQTVTYFVFGLIMSNLFDYGSIFQQDVIRDFMRPIDSPATLLGPLLQPIRGLLFAIGLWPIRNTLLESKRGWLILWGIFIVFGILSTPAAAPSSLEGLIYSKLPLWYHLIGLPEMLLQTLAFSLLLTWWEKRRYQPAPAPRPSTGVSEVLKAVVVACFAYMGYAAGSLLSAAIARIQVDMEAAASDWRTQMMFVVAFVVNVILIFGVSKRWLAHKMALWQVFLLFWAVDTLVPLGYQFIFLSPMPLPLALLIGFFPALVITVGMPIVYKPARPTS